MPIIKIQSFASQGDDSIKLFTLGEVKGVTASITNYGGIVTQLHVPDREGNNADVVLGFNTLEDYLRPHPYFGALIGRNAGRLTGGQFELEGKTYHLEINDPPNHLHGGKSGFDKCVWSAKVWNKDGNENLVLTHMSPDGHEGYPGNLNIEVTYSLKRSCELWIDYKATTDKPTPLNMTNHAYFNLSGEGNGDIRDHEISINADEYIPTDDSLTLTGKKEPVMGRPNDFRKSQPLHTRLDKILKSHGDNYLINRTANTLASCARVTDPKSGRTLEVLTTEPCLQFYSGCFLDGTLVGKSGRAYESFAGLCLECQGYPDAPNDDAFGSTILYPDDTYHQTTVYRFMN